ncbi:MAG TPA: phosphoribosylanthranilate isomerase [Bacteroidia bacterium]|jgi:phosphoribosylanthranilate isomerase|nr:phosphoribosylanthranilate isomerase [Bacteroidia bacterium]
MKLKVCGLNNRENILQVLECKPDYIGFIFYDKSPRFIGELSADFVKSISLAKKVGVFVNENEGHILDCVSQYELDYVQLHGDESPEFSKRINKVVPVIKAFQVDDTFDFSFPKAYEQNCEFFLFDSKSKNYGGSGKSFNHEKLDEYILNKPVFLSGGLNLNITEDILYLQSLHPNVVALDVNSKFEIAPGVKDEKKIKMLIEKLKK